MADSKISALTSGNPAQSGDEIPIARGGANYKITAGSIASLGGDVDGPASSVDNQIALFDSTTGKLIKAATTTGVLKASSGVIAAATSGTDYAPATTGTSILKGSGTGGFSNAAAGTDYAAATTGTNAQLLANNGSGGFSNVTVGSGLSLAAGTLTATGGGGGLSWQAVQTTGFTAVAGRAYPCNTTSAAFTVTLPASPNAGDQVLLTDYAGTWDVNAVTVNPNGLKIYGSTDNQLLTYDRGAIHLVYIDTTQGWITASGLTENPFAPAPSAVEYIVVAGGAGGAGNAGGGGGAGGFRTSASFAVAALTNYTVTVGGGGAGGGTSTGASGSNSVFSSITSAGGGGGASDGGTGSAIPGVAGGSGGGSRNSTGGAGNTPSVSPSQGNAGGNGTGGNEGAGGGGASASGGTSSGGIGGAGGNGSSSSITGTATTYAGGGGGGAFNGTAGGAGGSGGGGAGSTGSAATAGATNFGGGGGGRGNGTPGAAGGSGVVIIAYPSTYRNLASVGAGLTCNGSSGNTTPDTSSRPGYKVYRFTAGTGIISW